VGGNEKRCGGCVDVWKSEDAQLVCEVSLTATEFLRKERLYLAKKEHLTRKERLGRAEELVDIMNQRETVITTIFAYLFSQTKARLQAQL
jgi:hypothetical protein